MVAKKGFVGVARAVENDFSQYSRKQILAVYNYYSTRHLSNFGDKLAMYRRTQDWLDANGVMVWHEDNGAALFDIEGVYIYRMEQHPKNTESLGFVHRDSAKVIRVLVVNPKLRNSNAWKRFNLYKDGMTIHEYRMACRNLFGGKGYGDAEGDLGYDEAHGFIRIEANRDLELSEHAVRTVLEGTDHV
jgi:hypothetical protein